MKKKIVALVPMRHHSERIPGKNYRDFNGKPLFYWVVRMLSQCEPVDAIYINTDSDVIKEQAPKINRKVNIIDRPKELCSDHTPMNDILLHDVSRIEADYYLQTHATNPLLTKKTLEKAIETFLAALDKDSLFGVTKYQTRLWDKDAKAVNHDPKELLRTQDLAPLFEENSNIYIFSKDVLVEGKNRIGKKPVMFEIPKNEAWDIDGEVDFQIAEAIFKMRGGE
jgi:CMP-N-acetylneuraminic acid synthetase